jgi:glutamyl-tRNA synthetase
MIENIDKKIRAYALKNAIAYSGRANSGSVLSSLFNEGLEKSEVKNVMPKINEIIKEISKLSLEEQEKEFEKLSELVSERKVREGLPELPNAEKGVIMRIAPSPSGPLHVMHAVVASYSYLYVKKYGGEFIVRIEDTNPENIYAPAYEMISEEVKWLFKGEAKVYIQSDRMQIYYDYAEKLIKKNSAYVCTCSQEDFKNFSENKKDCPCRKKSVEKNLEDWKKMFDSKKGFAEGEAVLRFKTTGEGMKNKNPAMRDFPLARINESEHPRQGKKYRVWPLMNLAVATDDIEMKMTHIIRGKDHRDNSERQKMIYSALGKEKNFPWCAFIGRTNFKEMALSTSQTRKDIEEKKYSGFDDPRLPFVASLKKRGYKPEAFWKMAEHIGISEVDKVISMKDFFDVLDKFNSE